MSTQQQLQSEQIDGYLAEALAGNAPEWRFTVGAAEVNDIAVRAGFHGVHGLLNDILHGSSKLQDMPEALKARITLGAREAAIWELRHRDVLDKVLRVLDAQQIPYLLFKGTALAYSIYKNPTLRMRGDSDLLVAQEDKAKVVDLMLAEGFEYSDSPGDLVAAQGLLEYPCPSGGNQQVDLHWKISNSVVLSQLFDFQSLQISAVALPALSAHAQRMDNVNALLLAVVHAHNHRYSPFVYDDKLYFSDERLIWLYDVHLLAIKMSDTEWEQLIFNAKAKDLGCIVSNYLLLCAQRLATDVPEKVLSELGQCKPGRIEAYVQSSAIRRKWKNFLAQPSWKLRLAYFTQTFFPPASVMRERYGSDSTILLPWFYFRRACSAIYQRLPFKQKTE